MIKHLIALTTGEWIAIAAIAVPVIVATGGSHRVFEVDGFPRLAHRFTLWGLFRYPLTSNHFFPH